MDSEASRRDPASARALEDSSNPVSWAPSKAFLRYSVWAILAGEAIYLAVLLTASPEQWFRASGPILMTLVALTGGYLLSRGKTSAALHFLAYGAWATITTVALINGGIKVPLLYAYPLVILLTGWLISAQAAILIAILTSVTSVGLVLAQTQGLLRQPPEAPLMLFAVAQTFVNILSAALVIYLVKAYKTRLEEINTISQDYAQRTRELEVTRSELDQAQAVARVGSWVYDLGTDTIRLSDETCRIFGLPSGTVSRSSDYLSSTVPDDRDELSLAWQVALRGHPFDHEHRIRVGDTIRWIRQKADMQTDAQGLVLRAVGICQDITERKLADEKIQNLAFFDPLTELPNRRLLMDRLRQSLAAGLRHQSLGALLFIDLDNFKSLNDTHGHDQGDQLLQMVARRLSASVRSGDTVARLGGDEFVVMLNDLNADPVVAVIQAEHVAEKILAALNQGYPLKDHEHHSTPSIGVTLFGEQSEDVEAPLKRADLAMYQAKTAGRNTIRFFDPQMQAVVAARTSLEQGLREALGQRRFTLHFQPQIQGEREVTGAEVLLRWQHPERGLIMPGEFIALAEETGLIIPIGNWVLESACAQLARWSLDPEFSHLSLSVNVSASQFHQADFVGQVLAVLARTGADPHRLKLELTESMLIASIDDVTAKMAELQGRGVGFSLDDFGTGYSSLAYLKRLPLDQIKIDQSFVRDILVDANDAAIARMVVLLADNLGLRVLAEGVETEAQKEALAAQGCHSYQGYLFSRPLPIEAFEAFVRRSPSPG